MSATATTTSVAQTQQLAARLATACEAGDLVVLVGGLGAGKTRFSQGFAAALGVEGPVTSPTFTLLRQYPLEGQRAAELLHADLWRLEHEAELSQLAIPELLEDRAIALIEWGERAGEAFGRDRIVVTITTGPGDDDRSLELEVLGASLAARREALEALWRVA